MNKIKTLFLLSILSILLTNLYAQTPQARTWYYNQRGIKTVVKERWEEDSEGLKNGTYIKYLENGERETLGHYSHGKASGQWEVTSTYSIYSNKLKYVEYINYLNDELHGLYKKVSISDGNIVVMQGSFVNGLETGYWKEGYDSDKNVYREGNYVKGKRDGTWINTKTIVLSDEVQQAKQYAIWDENGVARSSTVAKNDVSTIKGYKTVFKNDIVIGVYDDKGINLLEKELIEKKNKTISSDFSACKTKSDFQKFRSQYPNSEFDDDAIIEINKLDIKEKENIQKQKEEDDFLNSLLVKWRELPDSSITISFFDGYLAKYPHGYRINEVKAEKQKIFDFYYEIDAKYENGKNSLVMSKQIQYDQYTYNHITLDNTTDNIGIYDEFFQKYPKVVFPNFENWATNRVQKQPKQYQCQIETLIKQNDDKSLRIALSMLNIVNKYSSSLNNSYSLPFSIQLALVNWKLGNIDITIKEAEKHKNDVIEFSTGKEKYSKVFKQYYKDYKLIYPEEKKTWDKISDIFN